MQNRKTLLSAIGAYIFRRLNYLLTINYFGQKNIIHLNSLRTVPNELRLLTAILIRGGILLSFLLWFLFVHNDKDYIRLQRYNIISIYTTYALPTESTYGLKTKRKVLMPEHRDF